MISQISHQIYIITIETETLNPSNIIKISKLEQILNETTGDDHKKTHRINEITMEKLF